MIIVTIHLSGGVENIHVKDGYIGRTPTYLPLLRLELTVGTTFNFNVYY
jgi:hypothetical protein